jgi:hypothetical protein
MPGLSDPPTSFVAEFRLSMTEALRRQLLARLEGLRWASLTRDNVDSLARRGGVYQLALDGSPVYVGKSKDNLPVRLGNHLRKLSGRREEAAPGGSSLGDRVSFRCVYVDEDLDAVAPEKMLMSALAEQRQAPWNTMGFGNKDPGRRRDQTLVKAGHFDKQYPIDLDVEVRVAAVGDLRRVAAHGWTPASHQRSDADPETGPVFAAGEPSVALGDVMEAIKKELPFTYRYEAKAGDLSVGVPIDSLPPDGIASAGEWFEAIASLLPAGWVHVALPGYVIAYPALDETTFGSRSGTWRSTGGESAFVSHDPDFAHGTQTDEDLEDVGVDHEDPGDDDEIGA